MAERLLGPLLQPEHQALLDTLICYLDHNGNAKATAQAMFLHPNTLHYRLRKIQSLLHRDLGQSEDFFQVMLGRKLYDFITKTEKSVVIRSQRFSHCKRGKCPNGKDFFG